MLAWIDGFLNRTTMYRLVLYHLIVLVAVGVAAAAAGWLPFSPLALAGSVAVLVAVGWGTNWLLAKMLKVPVNVESPFISGLIVSLVMTPATTWSEVMVLAAVAAFAMASKYVLVIDKRHVCNPVAIALLALFVSGYGAASWWVSSSVMWPVVALGGWLVVRKLQQERMVAVMIAVALLTFVGSALASGVDVVAGIRQMLVASPLLFFATVMFVEPLTAPVRRQLLYAVLVGVLYSLPIQVGRWFATPELALVAGNIMAAIASPNVRRVLRLVEKIQTGPELYDFVFAAERPVQFQPGQYMEWTLSHRRADSRGVRRYFTVAASPTEQHLRIGVRFNPKPSSFKRRLLALKEGDMIVASQVAGDFVLPENSSQPCVLIAGGIGVTPYRSMIQYLLDKQEKRPITIFYAAKTEAEFVYRDIFDRAQRELGIRTVYVPEDTAGRLSADVIQQHVPNISECVCYVSGPRGMVMAFEGMLQTIGVPRAQIKTDFFPGYA